MKLNRACIAAMLLMGMAGCGGGGGSATSVVPGSTPSTKTLAFITVKPLTTSVTAGTAQAYTATGTYNDNSVQDVTSSVTWKSSNTSVATVSNASGTIGTVTAVAAGYATITATSGAVFGTGSLTVTAAANQANIVPITVNGSLCSSGSYANKPCVSVTICTPGTSNCQTVTDILLDTGSYGLRIMNQALTVPLTPISSGSGSLAECVQFGDDSSEWGPVQMASVVLGNEPPVLIPIHVVNQNFSSPPSGCTSPNSIPDTSPSEAGFNGILGVGLFTQDCGSNCSSSANNAQYYSCSGTACTGVPAALADQVANPVASLPVDNNGVLVNLPPVALGGVSYVKGSLILGIGTQTNNQPTASVTEYPADSEYGQFTTTFNGETFTDACFLDTGSNGLFFDVAASVIPQCSSSNDSGFFCPQSTSAYSATNAGYTGSPSGKVNFEIGNADYLFITSYNVFSELGGYMQGGFDWGLPFFFGRNVFIGIEGTASSLGNGPYWAY